MAFEVLKTGNVGVAGSTGTVLHRSLMGARALIGRSLAEVRLTQGVQNREPFLVSEFIEELAPAATLEANARGIDLTVCPSRTAWPSRLTDRSSRRSWETCCRTHSSSPGLGTTVDAQGRRQRRARAHRDPGRMRRSPGRERQRAVPPVRAAQAPIEPAWALASPSADGASKRTMAASMRATCPIRDASSPSTCRGFRFPPSRWCSLSAAQRIAAGRLSLTPSRALCILRTRGVRVNLERYGHRFGSELLFGGGPSEGGNVR